MTDIYNFSVIKLNPPLPIYDLVKIALDEVNDESQTAPEEAELMKNTLVAKAPILKEYFSIIISENGDLHQIPDVLGGHQPSWAALPSYLLNLALCVNWDEEKVFFQSFAEVTARFYSKMSKVGQETDEQFEKCLETVIVPAIRDFLLPSKQLMDLKKIMKITDTNELYKTFERC